MFSSKSLVIELFLKSYPTLFSTISSSKELFLHPSLNVLFEKGPAKTTLFDKLNSYPKL